MRRHLHEPFHSNCLTSDRYATVDPFDHPLPYAALTPEAPDTLAFRPVIRSRLTPWDEARRIERVEIIAPSPDIAPAVPMSNIVSATTDAQLRRAHLDHGAARGLRRHGRARH